MRRRWGAFLLLSLALSACRASAPAPTGKAFDVSLEVDFGPAQRPPIRTVVEVRPGATANDALSKVCSVKRGAVCCDPRETAGVDGVICRPESNLWWILTVNGSRDVSPFKTSLKPGDRVRWAYVEEE